MSGAWIKVRTVLPTDGRLRIASRKCHASTVTCFGALVTLWCLADQHANENGELVGYTADDVDALIGLPGFCISLPADWIDLSGEFVKLPEYQQHNGSTGKSRSQAARRQTLSRANRDKSVTREDKKREEEKEKQKRPPAAAVDPLALMIEAAVDYITGTGVGEKQARSLVGMLRKQIGDDAQAGEVLAVMEREKVADPAAWLVKAGKQRAKKPKTTGNPWDGAVNSDEIP